MQIKSEQISYTTILFLNVENVNIKILLCPTVKYPKILRLPVLNRTINTV